jgi:hypothetical protein
VKSLLSEEEVSSLETGEAIRKGFWFDRSISLKFLQQFSNTVFPKVDVESQLDEAKVSALQTSVPVQKGHKFWSDRWIAPNFL